MRHVSDEERRARLAARHAVAPATRVADPVAATRAMTVLHATEPATVYLSLVARIDGLTGPGIDEALYGDRSLVKQLAMRRTLFVVPRADLPAVVGGPGARVAGQQRRKLAKELVAAGVCTDGDAWLARARTEILAALAVGGRTVLALKRDVELIAGTVPVSPGTKWGGDVPVAPRLLAWLGAAGEVVRGPNDAPWLRSKPVYRTMADWLGEPLAVLDEQTSYAALVGRWLVTFGPGTEADLVWWFGATKAAIRRALADVGAVPVTLDGDDRGWLHPDDVDPPPETGPWAALLPVLDPTTMGWRNRAWYLDPQDTPYLFDSVGNAGTTAWWNGRIVGCWVQGDDGVVHVVPRGTLPTAAAEPLAEQAQRLTDWLDGTRVSYVYRSPQMAGATLP